MKIVWRFVMFCDKIEQKSMGEGHMRKRTGLLLVLVLLLTVLLPAGTVYAEDGPRLVKKKVAFHVGNSYTFEITGMDAEEYEEMSFWYMPSFVSTNPKVAVINSDGELHAVGVGTTEIQYSFMGYTSTCKVSVIANSSKLSVSELSMYEGERTSIKITYKKKKAQEYGYQVYDAETMEYATDALEVTHLGKGKYDVAGVKPGNYMLELIIYATDGKSYSSLCPVEVKGIGLKETRVSIALGLEYQIEVENATDVQYEMLNYWNDTPIATVDADGLLKPECTGTGYLEVSYLNPRGTRESETLLVYISDPKLIPSEKSVWLNYRYEPQFEGTTYWSDIQVTSSNQEVIQTTEYGWYNCYAVGAGKTTMTYLVDGKEFSEEVTVIDPKLSHEFSLLKKKEAIRLKVTGIEDGMSVTYKSSNSKVASVTKNGKVTAKKNGTAVITVTVDGLELYCTITVASGKGVNAVKQGEKVLGSPYSQAKRMEKGYYDCSSFVWRMYKAAGYELAGVKNYAPTAADLAKKLEAQGKAIAYEYVSPSELKPGDIIFYSTGNDNGRYKNIDHVAMFYGSYQEPGWWGEEMYEYGLVIHASGSVHVKQYEGYRNWGIVMIARPY